MTAILDRLDEGLVERGPEGFRAERSALVRVPAVAPSAKLWRALTVPGIPAYGTPHPHIPGILLLDQRAQIIQGEPELVRVRLIYRTPSQEEEAATRQDGVVSVEIDSTAQDEDTDRDAAGELMLNRFDGNLVIIPQGNLGYVQMVKRVRASVLKPRLLLRVTQDRPRIPLDLATEMNGSTNAATWNGYPARTWLINSVRASRQGAAWRTVWQFAYRPETWRHRDVIEIQGQVPEGLTEGNGIATFDVLPARNWSPIGVTL